MLGPEQGSAPSSCCQGWALGLHTGPARPQELGVGFTPWVRSTELQLLPKYCGRISVPGKGLLLEPRAVASLEGWSRGTAALPMARGSRSSSQGSGCSAKQGWLHGLGEGGTGGSVPVIPASPAPVFAPQVCSQSLLRDIQRPSLPTATLQQQHRGAQAGWATPGAATAPGGPGSTTATSSHPSLAAVTAAGSPWHSREHPTPGLRDKNHLELLLGEHPAPPWECPWGASSLGLIPAWS